jgi:hypothetical protein
MTEEWFGKSIVISDRVVPNEPFPPWAEALFEWHGKALKEDYEEKGKDEESKDRRG